MWTMKCVTHTTCSVRYCWTFEGWQSVSRNISRVGPVRRGCGRTAEGHLSRLAFRRRWGPAKARCGAGKTPPWGVSMVHPAPGLRLEYEAHTVGVEGEITSRQARLCLVGSKYRDGPANESWQPEEAKKNRCRRFAEGYLPGSDRSIRRPPSGLGRTPVWPS